jgi:pimeloyl-ACP methyl ester carboxylesterase
MGPSFSFVDEGDKQALPVVFLHAFPYHSDMWQAQHPAILGVARFIAFDARGLGRRKSHTSAYMLEHTVDDLLALLDYLSIDKAVLCGLSMGGYVALRAVARAPERVRGLILANTQAASDTDAARLGRAEGVRVLERDGAEAFFEQQIKRQLSPHSQATRPELIARLKELTAGATEGGIAASLVAIATRSDQTEKLKEIRVPTLVIAGADDVIAPPAAAQFLAEQIPQATLHVLAKAGHLTNLEAETEFNGALTEFLARI